MNQKSNATSSVGNPASSKTLALLQSAGQSIWLDNLSRLLLEKGTLEEFISEGVVGLTTNPSIFKKAIADSGDYDETIRALHLEGKSVDETCVRLMTEDLSGAVDALKATYDSTNGLDGYASIEVSPALARNTDGTIDEGTRLWKLIAKPNVMIKVPATKEGLPAIEELLYRGINVNVTLIFSVERYKEVVEAYLRGLRRRVAENLPIEHILSVASFFVSRLDTKIEKMFQAANKEIPQTLLGTVAIANCRIAYTAFREVFEGEAFYDLRLKGGRVQRPLWASTSTKNSAFPPLLYVQSLAAEHTVNTLPQETLELLLRTDDFTPRSLESLSSEQAATTIETLQREGVSLQTAVQELEVEGLQLFVEAYEAMVAAVKHKQTELVS